MSKGGRLGKETHPDYTLGARCAYHSLRDPIFAIVQPGGRGVLASLRLPDGSEYMVAQRCNWSAEPYTVAFSMRSWGRGLAVRLRRLQNLCASTHRKNSTPS